ncbi:hypothetical protein AIGOOFII_3551 [Methylobacterium marchantiae]|nr:hypothetical protein AIGOOFII_3551 [Methylobacterium marchantiae]
MRPAARREVAGHLQVAYGISERRACLATGFGRSSQRYRKRSDPQVALRMRLKKLAAARVRYGYRRLHILLRREGWEVNHKRAYRIYWDEGLSIRSKLPKRKRAWRYRQGRTAIGGPNEVWAMDFMSDCAFDELPFRILTIVDCHTREALSLTPRANFRAFQVTEALDALVRLRDRSKSLRVDNGPEFAGRMRDQWAYLNGVEIDFSRPVKPTDNAYVESLNGRLRTERLNVSRFLSLAHQGTETQRQRRSTSHGLGRLDAPSLRRPSCHSPRTCIGRGPQKGSTPTNDALTSNLGRRLGVSHLSLSARRRRFVFDLCCTEHPTAGRAPL